MAIAKRIMLFLFVNFLIIMTLSILTSVLGIRPYLDANGINYESLLGFCLVWGMGGAFISLLLSRMMAKWMMGVKVIDPSTHDHTLQSLVSTVHQLSRSAGLGTMPQVGIYDSPEVNAFATGPSRSRSLVAVSTGLLKRMNESQVEGVLAHEISHVANGDMVTMALLQGIVNAFVMFLARAIAFAIANMGRSRDERGGMSIFGYHMIVWVLESVFMLFGAMVIAAFSRFREFRADAGGARLAGSDKMIEALKGLQRTLEIEDPRLNRPAIQTFKISTRRSGFLRFFATHPPLEERIARLEGYRA